MIYTDLSICPDKVINLKYFLDKISKDGFQRLVLDYSLSTEEDFKKPSPSIPIIEDPQISILNRATITIQNNAILHTLGKYKLPYDIVAVKPINQSLFHTLCTEHDFYDVMTFDIGKKLPFMLKRNPVYEAIRRGKYFQIYYEPLFDEQSRVVCMTNMVNIIKATGGKNLVLSSHASDHTYHRTPFQVAALFISLGLDKNKAIDCMKQNTNRVIMSGEHRRLFFKGAIEQIPVSFGQKLGKRIKKHRVDLKKQRQKAKKQAQEEE